MEYSYKFKMNKRSRRQTAMWIITFALLIAGLYIFNDGSFYVSVWFMSLAICLFVLFVMSIPKSLRVNEQYIDIHCVVELTRIPISNIVEIRPIENKQLRWALPLAGSFGFGGYFGYYFNLRNGSMFKMYARQWGDFVMITDVYEDVFVINCKDSENFIDFIKLMSSINQNQVSE